MKIEDIKKKYKETDTRAQFRSFLNDMTQISNRYDFTEMKFMPGGPFSIEGPHIEIALKGKEGEYIKDRQTGCMQILCVRNYRTLKDIYEEWENSYEPFSTYEFEDAFHELLWGLGMALYGEQEGGQRWIER